MAATLKYPGNLADSADWVKFEFFKYKAPYSPATAAAQTSNTNAGNTSYSYVYNASVKELTQDNKYSTIALYMPEDISGSYKGGWSGRGFGPLAPIALNAAGGILNATSKGAITGAIPAMTNSLGAMRNGALPYIGASAVAHVMNSKNMPGFGGSVTPNDILATTRGQILNPNMEVLYQGPELRDLTLTFKMFARSQPETVIIKDICNTFKKAMHPSGGSSTEKNLIGVPKIVQVSFMHKAEKHKWIPQYKACALGGVSINYTPDGSWATYAEGQPIAVSLQLQFQELKLIYEEDIKEGEVY